jgi:CubicO group peptidase (beta-lactamase class C family)
MIYPTKPVLLVSVLLFFLQINLAFGQELPTATTIPQLTALLQTEMQHQHIAGLMLTVVTKDSVLYAGGLGEADVNRHIPVTSQHLFRMASVTKTFTALAVLNLVHEKKLSLDMPLRSVAPEIPFTNDWESAAPVTIAQLLEHTTGFSNKSPMEEYNETDTDYSGLASVLVFKKYLTCQWRPGERHSYSNVNYAVLAYVVEKVSGVPFQEYMRTAVFLPLGMTGSDVNLKASGKGNDTQGYVWKGDHFQTVPHLPQYSPGNGSLHSNATDMAQVLQAYLSDWQTADGRQFLSKDILDDAEKPHTYLSAKAGLPDTYAYGLDKHAYPVGIFTGHSGAIGGYVSMFLYNRALGIGYAISINTFNEPFLGLANDLIQRYISHRVGVPKPVIATYPLKSSVIQPYEGYYRFSSPNQLYLGFLERWQHTFKLEQNPNGISVRLLLGGQMIWKPADATGLLFRNKHSPRPTIAFLKDAEGRLVITDHTMYFTKISALEAWLPLGLLSISLLLLVSSLFWGLTCLVLFFLRKISKETLGLRLAPMLVTLALGTAVFALPRLVVHIQECTPIGASVLTWIAGKYLFAFLTLTMLVLLVMQWRILSNKWVRTYLTASLLASGYLLGLLITTHWYP